MRPIAWIGVVLCALLMNACSDSSDNTVTNSEAQRLLAQLGSLQPHFTESGMQGLLDYEDTGRPVTLVQLISVTDSESFARYEAEAAALWESIGASERFRSEIFDQMIGDRALDQTRVIEFPSIMVLLSAMDTPAFTDLMDSLAAASDDLVWVLGEETPLPFEPGGSYFDPALQNLNEEEALALLASVAGADSGDTTLESNIETVIDMVVSDAPSPFWMVNLIDFYEEANFPDGRETDLSGEEANAIYSNAVLPNLMRYNSLPEFVMTVAVTLTDEGVEWEQVAIPRYASRDAFLNAFPLNPAAPEALAFKEAGVENTLVYASEVPGTRLPAPQSGPLFDFRYCEVLLFYVGATGLRADVYNSMLLGNCPQDLWDALDAQQIADDYGAQLAGLNGIRFWVLDLIEAAMPPGPPVIEDFGGIPMRLAASVEVAAGAEGVGEPAPYAVNRVSRDTVFHYVAGRQVYELEDPTGIRYRMQSFTRGQDPDQQLVDLQRLGQRLDLPQGWSFHVSLLEEDSKLPTLDGIAEVITDDLGNTYQRVP
jgi:uncharacterized protein (DUF1330 family)